MKFQKFYILIIIILTFTVLSACNALKYRPVSAKEFPPEPSKRVQKNIEEGRGFRLMDDIRGGGMGSYEFASSNPLWRASLDIIDFMPLATANYSGGIIVTDWYSEGVDEESIKISIRFLTNEIRSDALDINIFVRRCDINNKCTVVEDDSNLLVSLQQNILKKAAIYQKEGLDKIKKDRPYPKREPKN